MTIILALSLISFAVVITIMLIGFGKEDEDTYMTGIFLLIALLLIHGAFQAGAAWQVVDTCEKYELIKK